jgi:hypothetical protein
MFAPTLKFAVLLSKNTMQLSNLCPSFIRIRIAYMTRLTREKDINLANCIARTAKNVRFSVGFCKPCSGVGLYVIAIHPLPNGEGIIEIYLSHR